MKLLALSDYWPLFGVHLCICTLRNVNLNVNYTVSVTLDMRGTREILRVM